ncbi:uncharacterized protein PV09_06108 [Verruconis gallopava]|uniref:Uncharacterized protein n=1 Tax=Verruconis gallopava TaxID=253628 RepID=A0A0D1XK20_9PEZI|nr:uncharacterized protein PV09_06108 [Verruconis gallopava]KIW02671.1 hypothetical protein PV09_06108 [Verruconis gallopava]
MLLKAVLLLGIAMMATAGSTLAEPQQESILAQPACAECQPCPVSGCFCGTSHQGSCDVPQEAPRNNPFNKPICPQNEPCQAHCICPTALKPPKNGAPHHLDVTVCAEGQPCYECDLCSFSIVMSYINPGKLSGDTRICDIGNCNGTCVCREQLLESMQAVLFPSKGKESEVIDYGADNSSANDNRKEEL